MGEQQSKEIDKLEDIMDKNWRANRENINFVNVKLYFNLNIQLVVNYAKSINLNYEL